VTDIKTAWQNQPVEEHTVLTIQDLRLRAVQLQARLSRRNLLLYLYSAFNIVASLWLIVTDKFPTMQAPMLLMIVAHLFVLWQVWHRFVPRQLPPQSTGQDALHFHRQELERQHGAVANAWLWYIAPFMPAFIWELIIWLHRIDVGTVAGTAAMKLFGLVVFSAALFWGCVWLLFSRHATRLELELHRLSGIKAE